MNKAAVVLFAVLLCLGLATSMTANAQKRPDSVVWADKPSHWGVNVWGFAYHPDDKNNKLNSVNPGVGLRYHFEENFLGGQLFLDANFIFQNSFRKRTLAIGPGIVWPVFRIGDVLVSAGAEVPLVEYRNKNNKKIQMFGLIPVFMFTESSWTLNIGPVPNKGEKDGKGIIAAWVVFATWRF